MMHAQMKAMLEKMQGYRIYLGPPSALHLLLEPEHHRYDRNQQ